MKEHIVIKYRHTLLFYLFATLVPWAFWFAASYVSCVPWQYLCCSVIVPHNSLLLVITHSLLVSFLLLFWWTGSIIKLTEIFSLLLSFISWQEFFIFYFAIPKDCYTFAGSFSSPKLGGGGSEQAKGRSKRTNEKYDKSSKYNQQQ